MGLPPDLMLTLAGAAAVIAWVIHCLVQDAAWRRRQRRERHDEAKRAFITAAHRDLDRSLRLAAAAEQARKDTAP